MDTGKAEAMPPKWVADKDIWEKAKAEADKSNYDDYYAVVTSIYENMGGKKTKKKSSSGKTAVIKHEGDKWVLYDHTGNKVLGRHDTKEKAEKQEKAIQISKHSSVSVRDVQVLDVLARRLHDAGLEDESDQACRMRDRLASLRKVELA